MSESGIKQGKNHHAPRIINVERMVRKEREMKRKRKKESKET